MEEILKKIIDIDERAKKTRKEAEALVRTQEEALQKEVRRIETDLLARAEKEGKAAYDTYIKEGEEEASKILNEGEKYLRHLETYFNAHEQRLQQEGFSMIFKDYE